VLSGRGLCDELITRPEESYRLCCVVACDLETSKMGAPYIYDISRLRVNCSLFGSWNRLFFLPGYQVSARYLLHILLLTLYMLLLSIYGFSSDLHPSRSRVNCILEIVSEFTRHAGRKDAGHCEAPTIYMITSICDFQYSCLHII